MAQIPIILGQVIVSLILALIRGRTLKFIIFRLLKWAIDRTDNKLDNEILEQLRVDWELPATEIKLEGKESGTSGK